MQIYKLDFQPNVTGFTHSAFLTLNFENDQEWLIFMRGSYNGVDVVPRSLYIDNSLSADEVQILSFDGELNKIVPPRGQLWVSVFNFSQIKIIAGAGTSHIEITDRVVQDFIFQRTDGFTNYLPASNVSYANPNDLVTVDVLGRVQGSYAPVFANNNITTVGAATPISTDFVYPTGPASIFSNTYSFTFDTDSGTQLTMNTSAGSPPFTFTVWEHGVGVNRVATISTGSIIPIGYSVTETPTRYLIKYQNSPYLLSLDKATFTLTVLLTGSAAFTFGGVPIGNFGFVVSASDTDDSFVYLGQRTNAPVDTIYAVHMDSSGSAITVSPAFSSLSAYMTNFVGYPVLSAGRFSDGSYIFGKVGGDPTNPGVNSYKTVFSLSADLQTFAAYQTTDVSGTSRTGIAPMSNRLYIDGDLAVMCYSASAARNYALIFEVYDPTGLVATHVGANSVLQGGECSAGGFCYHDGSIYGVTRAAGSTLTASALLSDGSFKTFSLSPNIGISAPHIGVMVEDGFIFVIANITTGSSGVFSGYSIDGDYWVTPLNAGTFNMYTSHILKRIGNNYVYFYGNSNIPTIRSLLFQKTIFGVLKDSQNVAITGQHQITRSYPGSLSFNYNANNPIGNRGLVFGNTIVLNGLAP